MTYGSAIIIKNTDGKILLQHRDKNAPDDKNTWAMWGGGKEGDETPVETAIRELNEELAIAVQENQLHLYKKFIIVRSKMEDKEVSVFELQDEGNFKYELHEGDDLHFFSPQEIMTLPLNFVARPVLTDYFAIKPQ